MKIGESPLLLDTPWSLSKAQLGLVETRKYYRIEIEARRDVSHYYNRKRKLFHNAQPCGDPSDHERMSTSSSFSEGAASKAEKTAGKRKKEAAPSVLWG